MADLRRIRRAFSWLLAVLLVSGASLPSPALWQCRHVSRIVGAAFTVTPSAMPCRMGHGQMPQMACCPPRHSVIQPHSGAHQTFSRPACQPTLTRMAALPAATFSEPRTHLLQSLVSAQAEFPLPWNARSPAPTALSLRQRPPPSVVVFLSAPRHAPGLRAPPTA